MPERNKRNTLWRLLGLLKPHSFQYLACLFGMALIAAAERILAAYLSKLFVDAITSGNLPLLWSALRLGIIFWSGYVLFGFFIARAWHTTIYRVTANLRQVIFEKLQRLPTRHYESHHSGEAMSILTNDINTAEQAYQEHLLTLATAVFQGTAAAIFMFAWQWDLALLLAISCLAPLIINLLFAKPLRKVGEAIQTNFGTVSERLTDLLAGIQVVRAFSLGEWILSRFSKANEKLYANGMHRVRLEAALNSANIFGSLTMELPWFAGLYMVLTGHTTYGVFMALANLTNELLFFTESLGSTISRIQGSLAGADRLLDVLDTAPEPLRYNPHALTLAKPEPALLQDCALLEFEGVAFSYSAGDQGTAEDEVLKDLNLDVHSGQVVAIVGPSGGGKSTIFKLLLGYYPVGRGVIWVAGTQVNDYELERLRDIFAYVPQDAYLYSDTISENIRYGRLTATKEEIVAAAKAANAHDFIMEQPDGYETLVGERGARLSGGQRQRVAIARALLKDAPILLLDEATSALDSESEQEVQRALDNLMKGRTTLVIAHRLSTLNQADRIYVLDHGKIVEQGDHTGLLEKRGLFAQLYNLSFA